jgi:hypothetical protein
VPQTHAAIPHLAADAFGKFGSQKLQSCVIQTS